MKRVVTALTIGVVALLLPACAAANDVDDAAAIAAANEAATSRAAADAAAAAKHPMPAWLAAGLKAATEVIAASKAGQLATTERDDNALPDKKSFSDILMAAGFGKKAAECVYDKLASSPDRAKLAPALTTVATAIESQIPTSAGGGTGGSSAALLTGLTASDLTSVAGLDRDALKNFVTDITPCLDVETLLSLYGTLGGAGGALGAPGTLGGIGSVTGIAGLLALLVGGGVGGTGSGGAGAGAVGAAAAAGGAQGLPAGAQGLLAAVIGLLATPEGQSQVLAELKSLDPKSADVTNLSPENLPLVLAAFLLGLTPGQRGQLEDVSGVNFASLGLGADPNKLSDEQLGSLLLVSIPFIAAGLSATAGKPPRGADPEKIYVPPGADLSGINPLNFYPKDNFITALTNQGLPAVFGGCLYEKWRSVDPLLVGAGFSGGTSLGIGQLVLGMLSCLGG